MSKRFPSPSQSANDNGPLTSGQVKALKIAIAVMSFLIVAALVAIVARVIYLASTKKATAPVAAPVVASELSPNVALSLPANSEIKSMRLHGNRLLVHFKTEKKSGAVVLDLATGKTLSRIDIGYGDP